MKIKLQGSNITCSGCLSNVKNDRNEMEGMNSTSGKPESTMVTVEVDNIERNVIINMLYESGNPVTE